MSQANIPNITPNIDLDRKKVINLLLASIAMEELALSHIINAEGEKIQYILGTLPGITGPSATIDDLLAINGSIRDIMREITKTQLALLKNLETVLSIPIPIQPTGPAAIIPFTSGFPIILTTAAGGTVGLPAVIGFGNSSQLDTVLGTTIDLTGAAGTLLNFACTIPRNGTITDINTYFSVTTGINSCEGTIEIHTQLYASNAPDNTFTLLAGTTLMLTPALGPSISIGAIATASATGLSIPVAKGSRLLLVFSANPNGMTTAHTLAGYASASIAIS